MPQIGNPALRILLITDEEWNDTTHPNNVLSNWFGGISAELAQIYCSPGQPENTWCTRYYQVTDLMMIKSIFYNIKAGKPLLHDNILGTTADNKGWLAFNWPWLREWLKRGFGEILRIGRELVWYYGKYDKNALQAFIADFRPDVIFSARMASLKLLRLEQLVHTVSGAPLVAFTGDAEYTNRLISYSVLFWVRRWFLRRAFRGAMPHYKLYYTSSEVQKREYEAEFGDKFAILRKCAEPSALLDVHKPSQFPIRIVYAGKLYCNRWKTLSMLASILREVNVDRPHVELSIYTRDLVPLRIKKLFHDGIGPCLRGAVSARELKDIYERAHVALHVEALDTRNRLATRLSFSTKIIDCLASGCAVMAIAWEEHAGLVYLREADAALCATSESELRQLIKVIVNRPGIVNEYASKAAQCVRINHNKAAVQSELLQSLASIAAKHNNLGSSNGGCNEGSTSKCVYR